MGSELDEFLEQYHRAVEAVVQGDSAPQEDLWSRRDDVTLANPLGPPARGWTEVSNALRRAVSQLSEGKVLGSERISEYSSGDLAYILEIERPGEGGRRPRPGAFVASRDDDLQARGGRLEDPSSSRRHDHHSATG